MANTTSGTATFDKTFAIDEIIEDAFERIGLQNVAGYQLKSARRSLNILFQEWGNRGIHYWEVGSTNLDLVEGQADYDFFRSSDDGTSATTGAADSDNLKATYKYDTEGLEVYIPGSGILFENGVCATLTQTSGTDGSVTMTITGA